MALIRRGRRVADYLRADCFAVTVVPGPGLESVPQPQREALERHLDFARKLHIETRILDADDAADALVGFAHTNGVTQIFLAKPQYAEAAAPWCKAEPGDEGDSQGSRYPGSRGCGPARLV